ncbi:bacillithiol system redox-active protein YtxJ [Priestia megaterium]|nr:bacillithiol system redox-active protein YtxJ [Priestia megaterium]
MQKISTIEEFEQVVRDNSRFIFLKHSTTCPISGAGYDAFSAFASSQKEVPAYYLHVQEARPLSNYIAETYNVKHESPQALFFEEGKVKWHASHWKISEDELAKQIAK